MEKMQADQVLAQAALDAGVQVVTCYPGTPGSNTAARIAAVALDHEVYFEWSVNERVALEIAIGASMAGKRSLVCVKSVGMNVLLDPLMVLNLSGVHAGLVILLGDDPGAYGSQNDQDSRWIARLAELPLLEPDSPAAGYRLMNQAFELSEHFRTAVILRITRSFVHLKSPLDAAPSLTPKPDLGLVQDRERFFPAPHNAVALHRHLHEKLERIAAWSEGECDLPEARGARTGVLAAGLAAAKLRDVVGEADPDGLVVMALRHIFPLPARAVADFISGVDRLVVLEENDPFVEQQVRALAQEAGLQVRIYGQGSGHLPGGGELFRWQIQQVLEHWVPGLSVQHSFSAENEADERPPRSSRCSPDFYNHLFDLLEEESAALGSQPVVIVDPGCQVTLAGRANAKFAMGSAVAVAQGIRQAGAASPVVAIFGDSAFFHSSLPAICNAAVTGTDITLVIIDNHGALTTGLQPGPHVGMDAHGRPAPSLDIATVVRACGVAEVEHVRVESSWQNVQVALAAALRSPQLSCVILEAPAEVHLGAREV